MPEIESTLMTFLVMHVCIIYVCSIALHGCTLYMDYKCTFVYAHVHGCVCVHVCILLTIYIAIAS